MLILGIETSCDETASAVLEHPLRVRSSVVASQHHVHAEFAGVVPELASRAHAERLLPCVRRALKDAGVSLADLDAVAVTNRPGLIGSLLVGVSGAKGLAWALGVPLVAVDHVQAHLLSGCLVERDADPPSIEFPALGLVVSGGHTSLYRVESPVRAHRLGATIDDAVGEAFDKAATILGLDYPGGPAIDRLARTPGARDRAVDFPVSRLAPDSLDFSFSGLKTAVLYHVRGLPGPDGSYARDHRALTDAQRADVAASFERAAVDAVLLKLTRALDAVRSAGRCDTLLVGGGVVANARLRDSLQALARDRRLTLRLPEARYCGDNAAMIAAMGGYLLQAGHAAPLDCPAFPAAAC